VKVCLKEVHELVLNKVNDMTHLYLLILHDIHSSLTSHNWIEVVAADVVLV
jgi:hypothetical protein